MQRPLKILFISSEVAPFAKTGGLADVSGALPKILKEMDHEVRVFMPKYGSINDRKFTLREVIRLKDIKVPVGNNIISTNVKSAFIPNTKVQVYFVENNDFYNRSDFYVDPETKKDWADNAERFSFFNRAVLEILKILYWQPDIIHCNDWQTALIPFYLKTIYKSDPFFSKTKTLLSIHNLAFQGIFDKEEFSVLNIPETEFYSGSPLEFWGKINFLKAGIFYADLINTVSQNYAIEIQGSDEFGCGLQGLLKDRKSDLYGILNGVDYTEWNPEVDELIIEKYSIDDLSGKIKNKKFLVESQGLKFKENTPVIGMISRLTEQKGFDILAEIIEEFLKMDVQFILLGTGSGEYHQLFEKIKKKYPDKVGINLKFDNELAHQIEAGCDMFLMPSRFEPCGLNQIYSLKYGTIPIVRKTGGLADTVKNYNPDSKIGYGFVFEKYSSKDLLETIQKAVEIYKDEKTWLNLINRCMKLDFSWSVSAENYIKLYSLLVE